MNRRRGCLLILTAGLVASPASAGVFVYAVPSNYSGSSDRKQSQSQGIYFDGQAGELAYEQTRIDYTDGLSSIQTDLTAVLNSNPNRLHTRRFGIHYATANEPESDGKITLIAETLHYPHDVYGSALYYTRYDNDDADVFQISPRVGRYFWPTSIRGTLYLELQAHAISIKPQSESQNYLSFELNSHWAIDPWGLALGVKLGEQRSAVTDRGFTVYNLYDTYGSAVDFSSTFSITEQTSIKLGAQLNRRQSRDDRQMGTVSTVFFGLSHTLK